MKVNNKVDTPVLIEDEPLEEVTEFGYLGRRVAKDGDAERDMKARLGKARRCIPLHH